MDKRQFAEVMTLTAAAFDKEVTESLLKVYWEDLQEFEFEDFATAMTKIRRTSKWFPKIAEIRELLLPAEPDLEQLAIAEWDKVLALLSNSRDAERRIENPVALRVVQDLGGAVSLGRKSMEELVWVQKEFVRRYVAGVDTNVAPIHRRVEGSKGPALIGSIVDDIA